MINWFTFYYYKEWDRKGFIITAAKFLIFLKIENSYSQVFLQLKFCMHFLSPMCAISYLDERTRLHNTVGSYCTICQVFIEQQIFITCKFIKFYIHITVHLPSLHSLHNLSLWIGCRFRLPVIYIIQIHN